jgi:DNA-binding response OmpR family regulator
MRLLIIEDDSELGDGLASALAQSGYATDIARDGAQALAAHAAATYQLVILDLGLPDMDGLDLLRKLRRRGLTTPVLILTARDDLGDRVLGLDAGGDDYLAKPFALEELEARVRALLRRGDPAATVLQLGAAVFELGTRRLTVRGQELTLTASELAIFELLLRRSGRIVSKRSIFESLYGWDDTVNPSMVEVFVSRLRRKLERADARVEIRVFRGLGYRLEAERTSREAV